MMELNTHPSFIFAGAKDKVLTVNVTLNPNAGASAFVNSAGGMMMGSNITNSWSAKLPAKVDYLVGIDNNIPKTSAIPSTLPSPILPTNCK